uniref:Methyltransferase-like protein 22 n=1 Tax=Anopheles maculatus TaxID=74869 RepID=A0A182SGD3_9DIPT
MSVLEVTSELYAEPEFCSTDTDAISKFTFVYPNRRETDANGTQTGQENGIDKRTNGLPETGNEKTPNSKDPDEESCIEEESYDSDYDDSVFDEEETDSESEYCKTLEQSETTPKPSIKLDKDGDLDVERKRKGAIEIEHRKSTRLDLVGLQIWRGALLLADYIMHNERKFKNAHILELGSGVGLT